METVVGEVYLEVLVGDFVEWRIFIKFGSVFLSY